MLIAKYFLNNGFIKFKSIRAQLCKYSTGVKEQTIQVGGQTINFIKCGRGNHPILLMPGALGTIWSDFKLQIENLDKSMFTIVAWDPPGYGLSRPPNRKFGMDFYQNDATMAKEFMTEIGIDKFSIVGWSDGGTSAMILSAKYPESVNKLVIWGSNAYVIKEEIDSYERIRNIGQWSERMKAPLIKLYGESGIQHIWNGWCDAQLEIFKNGGDICKKDLSLIKCPTLIIHGDKDTLVAEEQPTYLLKHITGSKLHRFPDGKHNLHFKYAKEFNGLVTQFLLNII